MTILVVAAHPDDEVLGCGGTVARLTSEGHNVHLAILGEGATSRYTERKAAGREPVDLLRQQSSRAAELLGASSLRTYELPDNRFDTVPLLEVTKIVEALLAELSPAIVFTHHGGDLNVDHSITHRAVLTATRPLEGQSVRELYTFETPSSTEWSFGSALPAFRPNLFVDIHATLDLKLRALAVYQSETRSFPHPRSAEALRAIALRWGSVAGVGAAEAFELQRAVRLPSEALIQPSLSSHWSKKQ